MAGSTLFSDLSSSKQTASVWKTLLLIFVTVYAFIWCVSRLVLAFWIPEESISSTPLEGAPAYLFLLAFFLFFTPLLYLFNCWLAKRFLKPEWGTLTLYMGATFVCGALAEITFDTLALEFIGRPFWEYRIWPKHDAFTSGCVAVIWPMYGFYLYFFHQALKVRRSPLVNSVPAKGVLLAVDAMMLETLANIFSLATFNIYYFYYFGPDLKNFTSIEIFIPYVICGVLGMSLLKALDKPGVPKAAIGIACFLLGLVEVFVWQ